MCALTSLTMVKNQYELSKGKSYRQGINDLRNVSNRLAGQVELLFKAVKDLENEVTLMEIIEEQLTEIARKQGASVETIVNLTKENEEILAKQKVRSSFRSIGHTCLTCYIIMKYILTYPSRPILQVNLKVSRFRFSFTCPVIMLCLN